MNKPLHKLLADLPLAADRQKAHWILELLAAKGPLTRSAIVASAGCSRSAVSLVVGQMLRARMIGEVSDTKDGGRGRPSTRICVNPGAAAAIGIDFGFRHVRGVLADISHRVLVRHRVVLGQDYATSDGLDAASDLVQALLCESGVARDKIVGVGAAIPAPIDRETGTVTRSAMIPNWSGVSIQDELAQRCRFPVATDNDSKLAALAEVRWGAGRQRDPLVFLKLHSGVGGGVVLRQELVHGKNGGVGEFGHMSIDPQGPLCRCGNRGCLEMYSGIPAILHALRPALGAELSFSRVLQGYAEGDPACRRVLNESAQRAGQSVGILCNALNPETVVIGGRLADAGPAFLEEIRRSAMALTLPLNSQVDICYGQLGAFASAMGAVALVFDNAFRPGRTAFA